MKNETQILKWRKTNNLDPREGERVIVFSSKSKNPRVRMQIIDWFEGDHIDFDYYMFLPEPPTDNE